VRTLAAPGGRFALPGLDRRRPEAVYFLDVKNQQAAVVSLPGQPGDAPLTVRLQPCGSAAFRLVDKNGKPVAGFKPLVELLVTPGATSFDAMLRGLVASDFAWMINLDHARYWDLRTDENGRVTLPTLVPGAQFRLLGNLPGQGIRDMNRTFTVEAGQALDLKDLPVPLP
jgi:hypothetical protein